MNIPMVKTPTVYLERLGVWVKLENLQYTGSIKVRPAYFMLMQAMKKGFLKEGDTFIEASSGNTAVAMAHLAPIMGLRFMVVLPREASVERKKILKYLGAELVEVPKEEVIDTAKSIAEEKGYYYISQHSNPINPLSHELTTGPEALSQLPDVPQCMALGVGTGGTITGLSRFFRKLKGDIYVVGVRPPEKNSIIEGISRNYLPAYDESVVDREVEVSNEEVVDFHKTLAKEYGLFLGYSSAANILITHRLKQEMGCDVSFTVAPDGGDRYVSRL